MSLALNIFNEKTVDALRWEKREETARFIELVVRMWKTLNIKLRKAGKRLNDPDRNPFNSPNDKRFDLLRSLARMFKEMDTYSASSHSRVMGLTTDTSSALHITLSGIYNVVPNIFTEGYEIRVNCSSTN